MNEEKEKHIPVMTTGGIWVINDEYYVSGTPGSNTKHN